MYLTESEIMSTHEALKQTYGMAMSAGREIKSFHDLYQPRKFLFMGCGSSFMLAKGFANMFRARPEISAAAIAGGDYLVDPDYYAELVRGSIVVILSRSGQTSEILRAGAHMKANFDAKIIAVTMNEKSGLADMSDLCLGMPWAYDHSVCQTRSIANLYAAGLMLYGLFYDDDALMDSVNEAIQANERFMAVNRSGLEETGRLDFKNVVVLGDGPLCGIAEEGALAFTEIALVPGSFFNVLDYRHGPIVLNGSGTLTIIAVRPESGTYQSDLVSDVKSRGGVLVTVGESSQGPAGSDLHVATGEVGNPAVLGFYVIYVCQMIALAKAIKEGIDPDKPSGLDLFISLK